MNESERERYKNWYKYNEKVHKGKYLIDKKQQQHNPMIDWFQRSCHNWPPPFVVFLSVGCLIKARISIKNDTYRRKKRKKENETAKLKVKFFIRYGWKTFNDLSEMLLKIKSASAIILPLLWHCDYVSVSAHIYI